MTVFLVAVDVHLLVRDVVCVVDDLVPSRPPGHGVEIHLGRACGRDSVLKREDFERACARDLVEAVAFDLAVPPAANGEPPLFFIVFAPPAPALVACG